MLIMLNNPGFWNALKLRNAELPSKFGGMISAEWSDEPA